MHPSAELRELVLQYWQAFSAADVAFVQAHLSADSGILGIGTDPDEWYEGAQVHHVLAEQLDAVGGVTISPGDIRAYEEGPVGWIADRPTFTFPGGMAFTARFTAVVHREDGEWKIVQAHTSVGIPNEQIIGQTLPA
jgi:ketosteroid isomerase-like protein